MQAYPNKQGGMSSALFLSYLVGLVLFVVSSICFAGPIVITGNTVITKQTTYANKVIDMSNGNFTIKPTGTLEIANSIINISISPDNPFFAVLAGGNLILQNNTVNVSITGIPADSNNKATYQFIQVQKGNVLRVMLNKFIADTAFTLGFLDTQDISIKGFRISDNLIKNFHGGIYLVNSTKAIIDSNRFENVSFANIFNMGANVDITNNIFSFPGNLNVGDAIDVVNSNNIDIANNIIASGSGYGIFILGSQDIDIENNKITDGSSYAIYIGTPSTAALKKAGLMSQAMAKQRINWQDNKNIVINNNYFAQNRYGLAGGIINQLTVTNNIFIQRFLDVNARQYWTSNEVLLPTATSLTWSNNLYKEAFTQEVPGDNSNTLKFVAFPQQGGVVL